MRTLIFVVLIAAFCFVAYAESATAQSNEESTFRRLARRTRKLIRDIEHRKEQRRLHGRTRNLVRRMAKHSLHARRPAGKFHTTGVHFSRRGIVIRQEQDLPEINFNLLKPSDDASVPAGMNSFPANFESEITSTIRNIQHDAADGKFDKNYDSFFARARSYFEKRISDAEAQIGGSNTLDAYSAPTQSGSSRQRSPEKKYVDSQRESLQNLNKLKTGYKNRDSNVVSRAVVAIKKCVHDGQVALKKTSKNFQQGVLKRFGKGSGKRGSKGSGKRPFGKKSAKRGSGKRGSGKKSAKRGSGKRPFGKKGPKRFGKRGSGKRGGKKSAKRFGKRGFGKKGPKRGSGKRSFGKKSAKRGSGKRGFGKKGAKRFGKRGFGKKGPKRFVKRGSGKRPGKRGPKRSGKRGSGKKSAKRFGKRGKKSAKRFGKRGKKSAKRFGKRGAKRSGKRPTRRAKSPKRGVKRTSKSPRGRSTKRSQGRPTRRVNRKKPATRTQRRAKPAQRRRR